LRFSKFLKLHHTERRIFSIQWKNKHRVSQALETTLSTVPQA